MLILGYFKHTYKMQCSKIPCKSSNIVQVEGYVVYIPFVHIHVITFYIGGYFICSPSAFDKAFDPILGNDSCSFTAISNIGVHARTQNRKALVWFEAMRSIDSFVVAVYSHKTTSNPTKIYHS